MVKFAWSTWLYSQIVRWLTCQGGEGYMVKMTKVVKVVKVRWF